MCYSFKTSIISFTIGIISAIIAFYTRQYLIAVFILFYIQMQLSEAIIWRGIDKDDIKLNKIGTAYGKYLLPTHIFAFGLGYLISLKMLNKKIDEKDFIPLIIGVIFYIIVVIFIYPSRNYPDTTFPYDKTCRSQGCQNNNNRLNWEYPYHWYIITTVIIYILMMVLIKPLKSKLLYMSFFILTLLISCILNWKAMATIWCFLSAVLAPLIVLINYLLIRGETEFVA
jgi:hypothetical protein